MAYRYEPNIITQEPELVIDGFANGTGQSPETGLNIKNCNIESVTGTVRPNWKINLVSVASFSQTFTANASTDVITITASTVNLSLQAVQFTTTGTLPAGLSLATTYWLVRQSSDDTLYKVASSLANADAGTTIDITDTGSGTHTASNTASAVAMGTITSMVNVPVISSGITTFYQFAYDSTGKLWFYTGAIWVLVTGNTTSNNSGNGLAFFVSATSLTTYLFCIRNANMDVLNVSTFVSALSATWTSSFLALNSPSGFLGSHFALLAQDNKIYICDTRYIVSISEKTGQNFDPSSGATYSTNITALTLPSFASAQCLSELGVNLLVGDKNSNYIYPWDRVSTSFTVPLRVAESNVWRMKNVDNTVYILAGTKGHVFQTTGYAVTRDMRIPEYLSGGTVTWGDIEKISGAVIFGVMPNVTTANAGIYKLYTNVGSFQGSIVGSLICDETPLDSNSTPLNANALLSDNTPTEFYWAGCVGGIYQIDTTNKLNNYEAYIESELIPVGTALQPKGFSTIEYKLDYAPTSGGVRLSWRQSLDASYTVIKDFDCSGVFTDSVAASIQGAKALQIKAELKGGTGFNTPRLRELRLR